MQFPVLAWCSGLDHMVVSLALEMDDGEGQWMISFPAHSDSHSTILSCRFPQPQLPALHLLPQVLGDTVALAFVAYAISVSLAMIYAEKYHYVIDPNQVCAHPGSLGLLKKGEIETSGQGVCLAAHPFMLVNLF